MRHHIVHCIFAIGVLLIAVEVMAETAPAPHRNIEIQCGQYKIAITCGKIFDPEYPQDKRQCNHNILSFTDHLGKVFIPSTPKGFDERKTPVSMNCTQGKNGCYYVMVEFNNGPKACLPCMTYHLFESNGRRLTADMTDRMSQLGKVSKKLGIPSTPSTYIEGDIK